MSILLTAETYIPGHALRLGIPIPAELLPSLWTHHVFGNEEKNPCQGIDEDGPVAVAFVNEGRWLANCPFNCNSAQVLSHTDRYFYCIVCENYSSFGKAVPVKWPTAKQQVTIESILIERPAVFRNWTLGEPISRLREENRRRGQVS